MSDPGVNPLTNATVTNYADLNAKAHTAAGKLAGDWSDLPEGHALLKMSAALPEMLQEAGYAEMFGVDLQAPADGEKAAPFSTLIILQKFLRANAKDIPKAKEQLVAALKWRKEFQPLKTLDEVFDKKNFGGLGYVTELKGVPGSPNETDICAFNIYGAVKDTKRTFGDLDNFIRWRVALMELTIQKLHLADAKKPIPDYGHGSDPYQAIQVHDYLSVSFLRQPAEVKAASQKTIKLFQDVYPETMAKKYFVNVPIFMQWMFSAMKLWMAKETVDKMQWMSYGTELHKYIGNSVSKEYGGSGPDLSASSQTPKYDGAGPSKTTTSVPTATTAPDAVPEAVPSATTTSTATGAAVEEGVPAAPEPSR